jgi:hypothetical protein
MTFDAYRISYAGFGRKALVEEKIDWLYAYGTYESEKMTQILRANGYPDAVVWSMGDVTYRVLGI